jgi:hypothetical protein
MLQSGGVLSLTHRSLLQSGGVLSLTHRSMLQRGDELSITHRPLFAKWLRAVLNTPFNVGKVAACCP